VPQKATNGCAHGPALRYAYVQQHAATHNAAGMPSASKMLTRAPVTLQRHAQRVRTAGEPTGKPARYECVALRASRQQQRLLQQQMRRTYRRSTGGAAQRKRRCRRTAKNAACHVRRERHHAYAAARRGIQMPAIASMLYGATPVMPRTARQAAISVIARYNRTGQNSVRAAKRQAACSPPPATAAAREPQRGIVNQT